MKWLKFGCKKNVIFFIVLGSVKDLIIKIINKINRVGIINLFIFLILLIILWLIIMIFSKIKRIVVLIDIYGLVVVIWKLCSRFVWFLLVILLVSVLIK